MSSLYYKTETHTTVDNDGNERTTKKEESTTIVRNNEPDFIKLYTKMWTEFNGVPQAYHELFFQLAIRMTYCNSDDLGNAQLVNTGKPYSDSILKALNWKTNMLQKGLAGLVESGAIKKVAKGVYQINPLYFGKGEWKYNPKLKRGGVEDLLAVFMFKDKKVNTKVIWADDGEDSNFNENYRKGLDADKSREAVLKHTTVSDIEKDDQDDQIVADEIQEEAETLELENDKLFDYDVLEFMRDSNSELTRSNYDMLIAMRDYGLLPLKGVRGNVV